jgi:anti-sigma regulatory factor (Ser/Thr protein kinase)
MPYLSCGGCRLTVYTAAAYTTTDDCPRCGAPLRRTPARLFGLPGREAGQPARRTFELRRTFAANADAPPAARRAVAGLGDDVADEVLEDARLIVTELVTNSVLHGPPEPIELHLLVEDGVLRIEVTDAGPGFDPPAAGPSVPSSGGCGLLVVDALTERWGIHGGARSMTWAEVNARPAAHPASASVFA